MIYVLIRLSLVIMLGMCGVLAIVTLFTRHMSIGEKLLEILRYFIIAVGLLLLCKVTNGM